MAAAGHGEPLWLSQVCGCLLSHPAESASLGPPACGLPGSSVGEALQAGTLHRAAMPSSCCDLQATPASLRLEAEQARAAPTRLAFVAPQVAPAGPRWVDVGLGQQTRPPVPSGWLDGGLLLAACRRGQSVGFRPLPVSQQLHSTVIRDKPGQLCTVHSQGSQRSLPGNNQKTMIHS